MRELGEGDGREGRWRAGEDIEVSLRERETKLVRPA